MKFLKHLFFLFVLISLIAMLHACANRAGGPSGGPKDVIPPKVVRTVPANRALNFTKKEILIDFDELVSVDKPLTNVVISPPQIKPADIKAYGKRITVEFNEPLKDSTTYSIDFGNAIVDLNEQNPLPNYLFSFSTTNRIDTMSVSGTVVDAQTLTPMSGVLVGIYAFGPDSIFYKKPFLRIGRTDAYGHFIVNNMKKGRYKVFALSDQNGDYHFQPGEGLAMYDSIVSPKANSVIVRDSIWKDSLHFDSVHTYTKTRFTPNNILLRWFKENRQRQYFVKYERKSPNSFTLYFNTAAKQLPRLKALNSKWQGKYLLQKNATMDTLTYWLTDSAVWSVDTLKFAMSYMKTDSLMRMVPATDTLQVFERKARVSAKMKKLKTVVKLLPYAFKTNVSSNFDLYLPVKFQFEAPLATFDQSKIRLYQRVDSVLKPLNYKWQQVDSTRLLYSIDYKWVPEMNYELQVDSAAFTSIYRRISTSFNTHFSIKSLDEYSSLKVSLNPVQPLAVFQVLDTKDNVVATKPASKQATLIEYLQPGEYYLRLFIDRNGNGKWDPGDFNKRQQPEEVYYNPKKFVLKANWEFEENWNYLDVPLLQQKAAELIKAASVQK